MQKVKKPPPFVSGGWINTATGQSSGGGYKLAAIGNYVWEIWEHWEHWGQWIPMAAKENGILPEFAKWTLAVIGHS
jgi:hypothetical protein